MPQSPAKKTVKSVAKKPNTPRRRLAPEVRSALILDCAAKLIVDNGLTEITMERIGADAGVSKALIYNYFPNLTELLRALLEREIEALQERSVSEVQAAKGFEDLIRRTTRMYIQYVAERGPLLKRLWNEAAVARSVAEVSRARHEQTQKYFAKVVRKEMGLPLEIAAAAVEMQLAMTETAAQNLSATHNDVDLATDICVRLMLGGLKELAKAYAKPA
jgi:TetR/AcrR family transcriptional regulator, fatty acid biosynthesis regulator